MYIQTDEHTHTIVWTTNIILVHVRLGTSQHAQLFYMFIGFGVALVFYAINDNSTNKHLLALLGFYIFSFLAGRMVATSLKFVLERLCRLYLQCYLPLAFRDKLGVSK
jgi:hypothetical protein